MAYTTIGLTSQAFIIDAVVAVIRYIVTGDAISRENLCENKFCATFCKMSPSRLLKHRKLWQGGRPSRKHFSTCKMQIVRLLFYSIDKVAVKTAVKIKL